jgi:uncharacterized glyoxalase superfamily protein PhnB
MTTAAVRTPGAPAGFRTVSPYITVTDPERLMAFAKEAFGAEELHRAGGSAGALNLIAGIGEAKLFFAGGPMVAGREKVNDMRLWVPNIDEVYTRALNAGGVSVPEPGDRPYGERNAGVKDPTGNTGWIATRFESSPLPEGFGAASCYLMKPGALELIEFLKQAFSAEEMGIYKRPDGGFMHGAMRMGTSIVELGERETPPSAFYVFFDNVDEVFERAVDAGAKAISSPKDQSYGHRYGGVEDRWGNTWHIARDLSAPAG